MNNRAWVFPGQGSQFVGMGSDLYQNFAAARAVFAAANDVLGFDLARLCFEGPAAELTDTINAQPAILTHSCAVLQVLGARLPAPAFAAGHSLGEYSALVAAGALEFADALKVVRARGAAMKRAGAARPGAMAAILGLDERQLAAICAQAGAVQIANLNAPGQIVISGDKDALDHALVLAKAAGAKRAIPLAVSIAAHSELMRPALEEYRAAVMATPLTTPTLPVISNVTAQPLADRAAIRAEMLAQLTAAVQWGKSVEYMTARGVTQFIEIGPKDVLSGLIRRIAKDAAATSVGDVPTLEALIQGVAA